MELLLLSFFFFLTGTFVLNLYSFNIAKNVDIVGTAFKRNVHICKISNWKDFENIIFASKSFSGKHLD